MYLGIQNHINGALYNYYSGDRVKHVTCTGVEEPYVIIIPAKLTPRTKIYGLTQAKLQPDKCPAKQKELSEKKLSEN